MVLHLVARMKSDRSNCGKNERRSLREKINSRSLSHLRIPVLSLRRVGVNVRMLVSGSQTLSSVQPSNKRFG